MMRGLSEKRKAVLKHERGTDSALRCCSNRYGVHMPKGALTLSFPLSSHTRSFARMADAKIADPIRLLFANSRRSGQLLPRNATSEGS